MVEASRKRMQSILVAPFLCVAFMHCTSAFAFNVPNACMTIYDATAPVTGSISSPLASRAGTASITYTGVSDSGSGLKSVQLWAKQGASGAWQQTGLAAAAASGTFSYNALGDGTVYFALRAEDRAGNMSAVPTGAGMAGTIFDAISPVISLTGAAVMTVEANVAFVDPGATATDNVDGVITSRIVKTGSVKTAALGTYTVKYNVSDIAGNPAPTVTRTVKVVDTTPPVITLKGASHVEIPYDAEYTDTGATAYDSYEGDISSRIVTTGLPVNTNSSGVYTVTYNVADKSGNAATALTRTVVVASSGLDIDWPVDGSTWYVRGSQSVPINIAATSEKTLDYVQVTLDGRPFGYSYKPPYSVSGLAPATFGSHEIVVSGRVSGTTKTISATACVTFASPRLTDDADLNGLPDNPFSLLTKTGDAWIAASTTRAAVAFNINGEADTAVSGIIVNGSSVAKYTVPRALGAHDGLNIFMAAMSANLDGLLGSDAAAFKPEPEGYVPVPGNRYFAAAVINSLDGGRTYSEPAAGLLAARPIHITISTLNPVPERPLLLASNPAYIDTGDHGVAFMSDGATWSDATPDVSLDGGVLNYSLTRAAVLAAYELEVLDQNDTAAPLIKITAPLEGDLVLAPSVTCTGAVTDTSGLTSALVYTSENFAQLFPMAGRAGEWTCQVPLPSLGLHTIYVQAFDSIGNATEPAAVTVQYGAIGDVNFDGKIEQEDAALISKLAVTTEDSLNAYLAANGQRTVSAALADINLDGKIDSLDVTLLRRALRIGKEATNTALAEKGMNLIHIWEPLP